MTSDISSGSRLDGDGVDDRGADRNLEDAVERTMNDLDEEAMLTRSQRAAQGARGGTAPE